MKILKMAMSAFNRSDPLDEKAPLASMEDLCTIDTMGASPGTQKAQWSNISGQVFT